MLTAATLAWARALGEFGPLLIFAGATRNKTEVLSTTVFLELSIGDLEAAVAVSLIMVLAAVAVLIIARMWGSSEPVDLKPRIYSFPEVPTRSPGNLARTFSTLGMATAWM